MSKTVLPLTKFASFLLIPMFLIGTLGCSIDEKSEVDKCWDIESIDLKEAIEYGKSLVNKHPENIEAYRCLAAAYYDAGHPKEAYDTIEKAVEVEENKWLNRLFGSHNLTLYEDAGDYARDINLDKAIEYYNKGLKYATEMDDIRVVLFEEDMGVVYSMKGDTANALRYLRDALLELYNHDFRNTKGVNHLKEEITIPSNLAVAYYRSGNNEEANEYLQKAIDKEDRYIKYLDYPDNFDVKISIGETCETLNTYDCAEKYYLDATNLAKWQDDEYREALGYKRLAELYDKIGKKDLAKEYYNRAYKLFKSLNADGIAETILKKIDQKEM
ncbi:MAG: tetratricopeptide repeat protein [Sulfurihydrogenibium sp.]|jgi:tetratricopeptide (TPR) repeat protein|nr:tetratricopeptide repeat protein [Sulfurihydrogenibium sp.]